MSAGTEIDSLVRGNLHYLPVVPGKLEFAMHIRRALMSLRPQVVAIELPGWLGPAYLEAVDRLPEITAVVYQEDSDSERGVYLIVEPTDACVEAARTAREIGAEIVFVEPDHIDRPHLPDLYPDAYSARRIGIEAYITQYRLQPQPRNDEVVEHAAAIAYRLQGADPEKTTAVVLSLNLLDPVLDAMETPWDPPPSRFREAPTLLNPHPDCLAEIMLEMPWLAERYERWRETILEDSLLDRPRAQFALLKESEINYSAQTGDTIQAWQRRMMARYSRNLAFIDNNLVPGLFDLTLAARSVVDDNYAWEVWSLANSYSYQRDHSPFETVNLSGEEVFLHTRRMKLRRRMPRPKRRIVPRGLKPHPKERNRGEWAEQLDGNSICYYPPEDLVIEDYGKYLRTHAKNLISEERVRVEPFTTSILDGIDIRETLRNWHEKKIYVRKYDKRSGNVGAVVVIFDEDPLDRYTYLTTWLGEHNQESDMAFYSTHPFDHMVGPGIGRAEYGGFLMTLPPRRMYDVWGDPDYDFAESKSERLLLAALDYSLERHVLYVAAKPPRSVFKSIAAHLNRSIIYIPIGQLSPAKLKRIRVVHVLDGHDKRGLAKDYIW
ncbi:MAG: hypothetical protein HXY18_01480 [Bryobacteraceae bacterium]|nr:hypothetical protein [Bryobacteraceae bacterium]